MSELGTIDAVLLSHDHHDDNHDAVGRTLLPSAGTVITTVAGAKRLGGHAQGLEPWQSTRLEAAGRPAIDITATPCRHGPPLSRPIVGHVVGFALRWETQTHGVLWISGDTVLYDGVRESRTGQVEKRTCTSPRWFRSDSCDNMTGEAGRDHAASFARGPSYRSTTKAGSTSGSNERRSSRSSPKHRRTCVAASDGCQSASRPTSPLEPPSD